MKNKIKKWKFARLLVATLDFLAPEDVKEMDLPFRQSVTRAIVMRWIRVDVAFESSLHYSLVVPKSL